MFHSHPTFSDSVNVPQSLVLRTLCAVRLLSSHHGSSLFLVCTQKPLAICYVLFINNAPIQPSVHNTGTVGYCDTEGKRKLYEPRITISSL